MKYTKEFKEKVLNTLGYSDELKKALDENQESVGRVLSDSLNSIKELYDEWLTLKKNNNVVEYSELSEGEKRFYDSYWNNDQDFHSEIQSDLHR